MSKRLNVLCVPFSDMLPGDIDGISRGMIELLNGNHNINVVKAAHSIHSRFTREKIGALIHNCHCDALGL
ncbi:MAG: hypothetical protein U9P42_09020 [Candidatus Fermentibacteria bacterium]|nr:hypothetical protein [Candidatus Fermentibacteria bacterium]